MRRAPGNAASRRRAARGTAADGASRPREARDAQDTRELAAAFLASRRERRLGGATDGATPRGARESRPDGGREAGGDGHGRAKADRGGDAGLDGNRVRVVARVRPLNAAETARGDAVITRVAGASVTVQEPVRGSSKGGRTTTFTLDAVLDSRRLSSLRGVARAQEEAFDVLGRGALDDAWAGYNATVVAFGKTGSGKTHSILGPSYTAFDVGDVGEPEADDGGAADAALANLEGVLPRLGRGLFERVDGAGAGSTVRVEVSYLELYNEEVFDLLQPAAGRLRVRETPASGVVVGGLSRHVVRSFADVALLLDDGNRIRALASTERNASSSRSHTVFTFHITRQSEGRALASLLRVVDLAGSESARDRPDGDSADARARAREASHINRSLFMLGHCMSLLASGGTARAAAAPRRGSNAGDSDDGSDVDGDGAAAVELDGQRKTVGVGGYFADRDFRRRDSQSTARPAHVPYRSSVLTLLLRDSLGGNARTTLLATCGPSAVDYATTLSTLRYADRARHIQSRAVVNQTTPEAVTGSLQREIDRLRTELARAQRRNSRSSGATPPPSPRNDEPTPQAAEVEDTLRVVSAELTREKASWEQREAETRKLWRDRRELLARLGVSVRRADDPDSPLPTSRQHDILRVQRTVPHLVNLSDDPMLSAAIVYPIRAGRTRIGRASATVPQDIVLGGLNILTEHCVIVNTMMSSTGDDDGAVHSGIVIKPCRGAEVYVNGALVRDADGCPLKHGDRLVLGHSHMFVLKDPTEARRARESSKPHTRRKRDSSRGDATAKPRVKGEAAPDVVLDNGVADAAAAALREVAGAQAASQAAALRAGVVDERPEREGDDSEPSLFTEAVGPLQDTAAFRALQMLGPRAVASALEQLLVEAERLVVEANDMCAAMVQDVVFQAELRTVLGTGDGSSGRAKQPLLTTVMRPSRMRVDVRAWLVKRRPRTSLSSPTGRSRTTVAAADDSGSARRPDHMSPPSRIRGAASVRSPGSALSALKSGSGSKLLFLLPLAGFSEGIFALRELYERVCVDEVGSRVLSPLRTPAAAAPGASTRRPRSGSAGAPKVLREGVSPELFACFSAAPGIHVVAGFDSVVGAASPQPGELVEPTEDGDTAPGAPASSGAVRDLSEEIARLAKASSGAGGARGAPTASLQAARAAAEVARAAANASNARVASAAARSAWTAGDGQLPYASAVDDGVRADVGRFAAQLGQELAAISSARVREFRLSSVEE